ncbi:MAG TPA: glycosyltransferase [Bryobacteraceae bacterium]|nr:glycosyltransferase [Bryobacteraceae bacterium]
MTRVLITTLGSYGDLYPYLAVGAELRRRGYDVTIGSCAAYRAKVEAEGLAFHPVRPDIDLEDRTLLAYVMDSRRGSERVVRYLAEMVRESYADTLEAARRADIILTHPVTFASVVAAQKLDRRWISSVLAPLSFVSAFDPPVPPQVPWLIKMRAFGPGAMQALWNHARRQTRQWVQPILDLRRELGLPPGEHPLFDGSHSPALVLALFSRYLAAPQPDWPPRTVVTGFPFYDRGSLAPELERFLDAGPAPVVFTLGTSAVGAAGSFYVRSLEAVKRLGCRAVLVTGPHPQGLPDVLPPGVIAVPYAAHGVLFPRAAVIVHQGGVGTTAQAMRSGRPALVVPFGHDQFDNAARSRRHGSAELVYRFRYRPRHVARLLQRLLEEPGYVSAALALAEKVRAETGAAAAVDAIAREIGG